MSRRPPAAGRPADARDQAPHDGPDDDPSLAEGELDDPVEEALVPREAHGERLDKWLALRFPRHSRAALQRFVEHGRVTVTDGARITVADRKTRAVAGTTVLVAPEPPEPYDAEPEDIPLHVLFEDADVLVLDKPPGMVVHPAPGHPRGTLVNALLHHVGTLPGDVVRPGIVHRLDRGTSGVMIVAKTPRAHVRLVELFAAHDLDRRYVALALGDVEPSVVYDTFHHRHPTDRKRFTSRVAYGRRARTDVACLDRFGGVSSIECRLHTGRTHQIRVHLAEHGHPLLGDPVYGGSVSDPAVRAIGASLGRQALHAAVLALRHPVQDVPLHFRTEPPDDYRAAEASLRGR